MKRLQNKVALITGGTRGIGEAAVRLFAREGARVLICGRDEERGRQVQEEVNREIREEVRAKAGAESGAKAGTESGAKAGAEAGRVLFFRLDVTDYENWKEAIAFAKKNFGKLNIVVNNAGISYAELIEDTPLAHWDETIAVNQTGVFYGIKAGIEAMKDNGEPCAIVSTSSVDGVAGDPQFTPYCAAKAAVVAMTKCAAIECGQKGYDIRVNAVAPGYIESPMYHLDAQQRGMSFQEYTESMTALHPIGRIGRPEDVARAYLYLASDEAAFVTGTTLMVDGGYTAW